MERLRIVANPRVQKVVLMSLACAAAVLSIFVYDRLPRDVMRIDFIDVGQGDGILITMPDRTQIVVDTGPPSARFVEQLSRYMPMFDTSIDMVIITHHDSDHSGGMAELLRHYTIGTFMYNGTLHDTQGVRSFIAGLRVQHPRIIRAERGQIFRFGEEIGGVAGDSSAIRPTLTVLAPASDPGISVQAQNVYSVVMRVDYGETSVLITGDIEAVQEQELVTSDQPVDVDILKVAHHGSKTSSIEAFIDAVSPGVAIIQVAAHNSYGHPSPEVITRYHDDGVTVFRNDSEGTISVVSDGQHVRVLNEKSSGTPFE